MNDLVLYQFFLHTKIRVERLPNFLVHCLLFHIDMNRILPVKISSVSPNLLSKLLTLSQNCNVSNPGKMFHSNSVGSPSIPSKFL